MRGSNQPWQRRPRKSKAKYLGSPNKTKKLAEKSYSADCSVELPPKADLQRFCPFIRIPEQRKSNLIHHLHSSSCCLLKIKVISCRCSFHLNNLCLTLETKHFAHLKWPKCAFLNKNRGRVIFTPSQTEKLEKKACVELRVFRVNFCSVKG